MPNPIDVYMNCEQFDTIPDINRKNWDKELELLISTLKKNASVLQVGCMDGFRLLTLLNQRPDLRITGIEIDRDIAKLGQENIKKAGVQATIIVGDITHPPPLAHFDYAIALNNTLGFIENDSLAIQNMNKAADTTILSVFGDQFTNTRAQEYFKAINLQIESIEGNNFKMKDFSTVKRYSREEVEGWGATVIDLPVGYFCAIENDKNQ